MVGRKARGIPLVTAYAERIDRRAIERGFAREPLGHCAGIYALFKNGKLRYVGLAESNLERRVRQHLHDNLAHAWNSFSVYLLTDRGSPFLHDLEATLHRVSDPDRIGQIGKFIHAVKLSDELNRRVQGSALYPAIHSRRIEPGTRLRMKWRGKFHYAKLTRTGRIRYRTREFDSPSGAARRVSANFLDGWHYWEYERTPDSWRSINSLR
jgi:hypothetical protein